MSQLSFRTLRFHELTTHELYQVLKLRSEIFVVEQDCVYQDLDDLDRESLHLLGFLGAAFVAYCRILPPGLESKNVHIGRVIVRKDQRGSALGKDIMKKAISICKDQYSGDEIEIAAQKYLRKFYEDLGFQASGEDYLLDGIPHLDMQWRKTV